MTRSERGALAVWTAVALLGFMVTVGIGVDFAGHARAAQEARAVAAQAARAGGQEVALSEGQPQALPGAAAAAARQYAEAAGYTSTVTVQGPVVTVEVAGDYDTMFLGVIGIWEIPVSGVATADARLVIAGVEREEQG